MEAEVEVFFPTKRLDSVSNLEFADMQRGNLRKDNVNYVGFRGSTPEPLGKPSSSHIEDEEEKEDRGYVITGEEGVQNMEPEACVAGAAAGSSDTSTGTQMKSDTTHMKCKKFLTTLLRLSSEQPEGTVVQVKTLIQGLIDGSLEPEKLEKQLNSSRQPVLDPFLKESLPFIRGLRLNGDNIEIKPPDSKHLEES